MTTTTVAGLDALRTHLAEFELPDLCSVHVVSRSSLSEPDVTAQLACHQLPQIARALLAWADTLTGITVEAWRVPHGDSVHLSVLGQLPDGASIQVYRGMPFTQHGIGGDLAPDTSITVALTVLRARAAADEVTV